MEKDIWQIIWKNIYVFLQYSFKKYNINTIFYSSIFRSKIIKINEYIKQKNNLEQLKLINFDKEKNINAKDYNKIMNTGRYIENIIEDGQTDKKLSEGNTIIVTANKEKIFCSNEIINEAIKIKRKLHIWSITTRKITATNYMQSQFDICMQVVVPLLLGICLNYDFKKCKMKDIIVQKSNIESCQICRGKNIYKIWEEKNNIEVSVAKRNKIPKFEIIKNEKFEKKNIEQNFILIK